MGLDEKTQLASAVTKRVANLSAWSIEQLFFDGF